jgi:hypothetical protein
VGIARGSWENEAGVTGFRELPYSLGFAEIKYAAIIQRVENIL